MISRFKSLLAQFARERCDSVSNQYEGNERRCLFLFVSVFIFYIVFMSVNESAWVFKGEMWAEMGTNYYPFSVSRHFLERFFATDSGYIPFPQRIIAFLSGLFLSAGVTPYYYTWSSLLISAGLIAAFCLKPFRPVINNDFLRSLISLAVCICLDFETRTFINFSYIASFLVLCLTALALVTGEVPLLAWIIPIFIFSKPTMLALLPGIVLVAIVSGKRFRKIAIASIALSVAQVIRMKVSLLHGTWTQSRSVPLTEKLLLSVEYYFGVLGHNLIGGIIRLNAHSSMIAGILLGGLIFYSLLKWNVRKIPLVYVGLVALYCNVFINCFALSDVWNSELRPLGELSIFRHVIVGLFACFLIVANLIYSGSVAYLSSSRTSKEAFASALFMLWFFMGGWLYRGRLVTRPPSSPALDNSHWQMMASYIDNGAKEVCVPVNPLGWIFSRECNFLSKPFDWQNGESLLVADVKTDLDLANLHDKSLFSFGFLAKPQSGQSQLVRVEVAFRRTDGEIVVFSEQEQIPSSGGLFYIPFLEKIPANDLESAYVVSNENLRIVLGTNKANMDSLWFGN